MLYWYWETAQAMVRMWTQSDSFAHAFLVPPISLWLIWRQRHALATLVPASSPLALVLVAATGFCWLLGELAAVNALTQFAFVAMLVLAVPVLLGLPVARAMMFPLAFLFFAVPFGEFVMPQFMTWTADFTVYALRLSGIPVYREGLHFIIPSGSWSVVEACSGIRYLIASVVVGTLYAYLNYRSLWRRLIFVGVAIIVPIVANWVRAYLIVLIGHLSNNKLATGVDHLIYGWLFFGVVILLVFLVGARWADHPYAGDAVDTPRTDSSVRVSVVRTWFVVALLATVTVMPHAWIRLVESMQAARGDTPVSLALQALEGWQLVGSRTIQWRPAFANPTAEFQAEFLRDERRVGLFVGYYRRQNYDHKLITSENALVKSNDPGWKLVSSDAGSVGTGDAALAVRTAELSNSSGMRLAVWQWYWINGRFTTSEYRVKALQAFSRLFGGGDDSAVVILYTPVDNSVEGGDVALEAFAMSSFDRIEAMLRQGR